MIDKPTTAIGYTGEQVDLVRATCLYVATKLGDLMNDLVIIGGLVPSLLIDQENLEEGVALHVGTMDLDIGLTVALLNDKRYQALTKRLRRAGFEQDTNENGNKTSQSWVISNGGKVTVDFLIPPSLPSDQGGSLRNIEPDFSAFIIPGLSLAFEDREQVALSGLTIMGEEANRNVWVCGPGAFVILKALAFEGRGENKDAYDLYYFIRNYGNGVDDIAVRLKPLLNNPLAKKALTILKEDFTDENKTGPRRVADFLLAAEDNELQLEVVGFVRRLLDSCQ
jgi:hypothetical protein